MESIKIDNGLKLVGLFYIAEIDLIFNNFDKWDKVSKNT